MTDSSKPVGPAITCGAPHPVAIDLDLTCSKPAGHEGKHGAWVGLRREIDWIDW